MYINEKEDGKIYRKRPGAYAIITREEDNKIGIISSSNKFFYTGGGMEIGETPLETLTREVIEETGYTLKNIRPYKILNSYENSESMGYLDVTANIFIAQFDKKVTVPVEKGYKLIWIKPEEYVNKMNYNWHNYILNEYIKNS